MPVSTAELSWRVLGFVNALRLLASSSLATLFVSIMPETVGQIDPALFAGSATAYFIFAVISIGSIRRRMPDIVLQTWTGVFADVLVLSLLNYASGGVNGGISALVVLSIGAASFILQRRLAMSIALVATVAMLIQPAITLVANTDAMGDFTTAAISGALTIVIALGIAQLARVLRQNEEIVRQRETASSDLSELHNSIAQHLREGVLVVDGENKISLISDPAATLLAGGEVLAGSPLEDVSPKLASLLDNWRRYFNDENRSTPTMMAVDGERRVQLKFVSLDSSTQGPTLVFVEDKARAATPAWMPSAMVPSSVEVNKVPVVRELPREESEEPAPREFARRERVPPKVVRERAFESPYAAGALREPSYEEGPYATNLGRVSALRSNEPQRNPFEETTFREGPRRPKVPRVDAIRSEPVRAEVLRNESLRNDSIRVDARREDEEREAPYRPNSLRENLARQNTFRAALQEVSPWDIPPKPVPQPALPPPALAPAAPAAPAAGPPRRQPQQPARPANSMLTNTDPNLRIIIGNALQFGRRESVRLERVDLTAWSKEFITEFWQTEEIDSDTVRLNVPRESVPVRADPAHLQKLLWALCNDLLKYGRASNSTDPVEIRVGRSATTQRRYLDIIDRGSAIGPVDSKRVFEPFLSVGKAGTGISMFVSRELSPGIRSGANNDPRPGGGVVFRFVFAEAPPPKPAG